MRTTLSLASKFQPAISLHGRHCLITGGSGALGSSIAANMARAGARVTLLGRDELKLKDALAQLQSTTAPPSLESGAEAVDEEGRRHRYLVIGDGREVKDLIAAERKIDVLVNAAGVPQSTLLVRTSDDEIERILGSNLTLTIAACKAATRPLMRAAPDSCIINMASLLGTHGGRGSSVYAASKAGIIGKQEPFKSLPLAFHKGSGLRASSANARCYFFDVSYRPN
ncbi:uncharacterized protein DNG_06030 [Cephalotrichum gorgonifer]|uniref:Ketoreductase domain-containing protein n=1 Tax=Cephalotrichum gorgonifer TaxID=2041049 RepID=A0AAE8SWU6_9PEZI|nr:uncharacterized protein DNG_06030 [Cephalotrichum gorgonifer]